MKILIPGASGFRKAHVELVEIAIKACRKTGIARLIQMSALFAAPVTGPA